MTKLSLYNLSLKKELREIVFNIAGAVHEQIVVAFTKDHARELAQDAIGSEKRYAKKNFNTEEVWTNPELSTCHKLSQPQDQLGSVISQEVF